MQRLNPLTLCLLSPLNCHSREELLDNLNQYGLDTAITSDFELCSPMMRGVDLLIKLHQRYLKRRLED